jgi:hypothetical protein
MFICCVEWYYVMCSVWLRYYYYNTFGFFWIVLWLVIVANAELSAFITNCARKTINGCCVLFGRADRLESTCFSFLVFGSFFK